MKSNLFFLCNPEIFNLDKLILRLNLDKLI